MDRVPLRFAHRFPQDFTDNVPATMCAACRPRNVSGAHNVQCAMRHVQDTQCAMHRVHHVQTVRCWVHGVQCAWWRSALRSNTQSATCRCAMCTVHRAPFLKGRGFRGIAHQFKMEKWQIPVSSMLRPFVYLPPPPMALLQGNSPNGAPQGKRRCPA